MSGSSTEWFQQGLGPRVDALEVTLKDLMQGEPGAGDLLRRLARSLAGPARDYGLGDLAGAADRVEGSGPETLVDSARRLITAVRHEAARVEQIASAVLLIGGDPGFNANLSEKLRAAGRVVRVAATAREADELLRRQPVSFIVLHLFLPDLDGRTMLIRLREDPVTTAIPVLLVAPRASDAVREETVAMHADALWDATVEAETIVEWVRSRPRRPRRGMAEARRDTITGLVNRAAFREDFARAMESCRASGEPMTLAVVAVDNSQELLRVYGEKLLRSVLQRAGSILSASLRATDVVGHWGTPEFAALFPGEDHFGGTRAIEKVIADVRKIGFEYAEGQTVRVTLSAGVIVVPEGSSVHDAVAGAERYLFQAQSSGGDRVICRPSEITRRAERVLIVMSDEVTVRVLRHLFGKDGFEVAHLNSADDAIAASTAESPRYHLILIDDQLAPHGGLDVLKVYRALPQHNRVPVVMLISRDSERTVARAIELGANDYVVRPFSPFTFVARMRRLLSRSPTAKASPESCCRILVVDDDVRVLLLAGTALNERGGFMVYLGKGGQDGLRRFQEVRPDALLLDLAMPDVDGAGFLAEVAKTRKVHELGVVLAADADDARDVSAFLDQGVRGVIKKPFNLLTLAQEVERRLGLPQNPRRPNHASEQLSAEVQRVVRIHD